MNASLPNFHETLAYMLTAMVPESHRSDAERVMDWWRGQDSHSVFEAHLPAVVPFSMIDTIHIPEDMYKALSAKEKSYLKTWFKPEQIVTTEAIGKHKWELKDYTILPRRLMMDTLIESTLEYVAPPQPGGLSLALHDSGNCHYLPMEIPNASQVHMYFRACGSRFFVVLSDQMVMADCTQTIMTCCETPKADRGGLCYMVLNQWPLNHEVISEHLDAPQRSIKYSRAWNWFARSDEFYDYHLTFDCSQRDCVVVSLEFCGAAAAY